MEKLVCILADSDEKVYIDVYKILPTGGENG